MSTSEKWSERDINLLKSLYPIYGPSGLTDVFSDRSSNAIRRKANELGIRLHADVAQEKRMKNVRRAQQVANGPSAAPGKDFREYEKVSSIFRVGQRVLALHEGGYL